jgi:Raf kinase inhibitor-like YbhB/YbcL family protein
LKVYENPASFFMLVSYTFKRGGVTMKLSTDAFKDQGRIPNRYVMPGAGGENVSVPLSWTDPPEGTASFALTMVDPHPVANNWVHWLVVNIPADVRSLREGASGAFMPSRALELMNSFGQLGYGGPQPPAGSGEHPYVFTIYALSEPNIDPGESPSFADFKSRIEGKTLATADVTGVFER